MARVRCHLARTDVIFVVGTVHPPVIGSGVIVRRVDLSWPLGPFNMEGLGRILIVMPELHVVSTEIGTEMDGIVLLAESDVQQ